MNTYKETIRKYKTMNTYKETIFSYSFFVNFLYLKLLKRAEL